MSVFWFFGPFFDYFFYCPKFQKWNFIENPWYTKIQHCTTLIFLEKLDFSKNWIFAILFKKVSFDGFIFWSIFWLFFLLSKVSKMKFYRKSLIYKNTTLYDIDFCRKIGLLRFFLRKFLLTVLLIEFSKNRIFHIPQYIIYLWSEFYARSNNQTIRIFG